MMNGPELWGGVVGGDALELRDGADGTISLMGSFPYETPAVLTDGGRRGRPRKEVIATGAFDYRLDKPDEIIHLLVGHDYNKPLASTGADTLIFKKGAFKLQFVARITPEVAATAHGSDALSLIRAGLATGVSPGFRIPPERAVAKAEEVVDEEDAPDEGKHRAIIRRVLSALLYEFSVVTRPAYPDTQIEARSWGPDKGNNVTIPAAGFDNVRPSPTVAARRWRA